MSAIFISHSSRDNSIATTLRTHLYEQNHRSVFLDFDPQHGIPAGRNWEQELYQNLRACQAVIVLCSEHSMSSKWCFAEIAIARSLGKHLFPIKIAACELNPILTGNQVIDMTTSSEEDAIQRLWHGLSVAGLDPTKAFDWDSSRPPYPGLLAFDPQDAAVFFGREQEIHQGLEALRRLQTYQSTRLFMVLGPSGSGKSSLVRAGITPRLQSEPQWLVAPPLRPRGNPLRQLALTLAQLFQQLGVAQDLMTLEQTLGQDMLAATPAGDALIRLAFAALLSAKRPNAALLLIIDQTEELLGHSGVDSQPFLKMLGAALAQPDCPMIVACTLRSDYLASFQQHEVTRHWAFDDLKLGSLSVTGLVQAIEGPANKSGLDVENDLSIRVTNEANAPGALPLVAFLLRELYDRFHKEGKLTLNHYDQLGGLAGIVARTAEQVLKLTEPLTPQSEADLRLSFLQLVRINEAGQFVRRTAKWDNLPASVHQLLIRFEQARLLVSSDEQNERVVEVAHEVIFSAWERLHRWLEEERDRLRQVEAIRRDAHEWQFSQRQTDLLTHQGDRLEDAVNIFAQQPALLSELEQEYLQACVARRDAARAEAERQMERLRDAMRMSAVQRLNGDPTRQTALLREFEIPEVAYQWMTNAVHLLCQIVWYYTMPSNSEWGYSGLLFHPTRNLLFVRQRAELLTAWQVDMIGFPTSISFEPVSLGASMHYSYFWFGFESKHGLLWTLSPDGRLELMQIEPGIDLQMEGIKDTIQFDLEQSRERHNYQRTKSHIVATINGLQGSFDPDQDLILTVSFALQANRLITCHRDGQIRTWSLGQDFPPKTTHKLPLPMTNDTKAHYRFFLSSDAKWAVVIPNDRSESTWLLRLDEEGDYFARIIGKDVQTLDFHFNNKWLATGLTNGNVQCWPLTDVPPTFPQLEIKTEAGAVTAVAFNPDGTKIAIGTEQGTVQIWDFMEPTQHTTLSSKINYRDQQQKVFSAHGMRKIKFTRPPNTPVTRQPGKTAIVQIKFDPTGKYMATLSATGGAVLWKSDGFGKSVRLSSENQVIREITFSQDGTLLATVADGETPCVWKLQPHFEPQVILPPPWIQNEVEKIVIQSRPAGDELRICYGNNHFCHLLLNERMIRETIEVDFFAMGARQITVKRDPWLSWLAFQATESEEPEQSVTRFVPIHDDYDPILLHGVVKWLRHLAVTPDSQSILGITEDGEAFLWSVQEPTKPDRFERNGLALSTAIFGANGKQLFAGCQDGSIFLCNLDNSQETKLIGKLPNRVAQVELNSTGDWIFAIDTKHVAWVGKTNGQQGRTIGHCNSFSFVQKNTIALVVSGDWIISVEDTGIRFARQIDHKSMALELISPSGEWVLTYSSDQGAKIWSLDPTIEAVELPVTDSVMTCAASNHDGTKLYAGYRNGVIIAWTIDLNPRSLQTRLWGATSYCLSVEERRQLLAEDLGVAVKNRADALLTVDKNNQ